MLMRTLLGLLNVRGLVSGQRITRAIVSMPIFLAMMLFAVLALTASPALAARGHVFSKSFAEPGTAPGQLTEPAGLAVNEATGDVYVADKGNNRIERFSSEGVFETELRGTSAAGSGTFAKEATTITSVLRENGPFTIGQEITGTGLAPGTIITAVKEGGSELTIEPATTAEGISVQLTAHQSFSEPEGIAVDNACTLHKPRLTESTTPSCATFDPSNGDVYVADIGHNVVDKFTASGEYVGQITATPAGSFAHLYGVAVDSVGKVWTFETPTSGPERTLADSFSNALVNQYLAPSSKELAGLGVGSPGLGQPETGFAVDSEDNLYPLLNRSAKGTEVIAKFNASGEVLNRALARDPGEIENGRGALRVAIELSSDEAYVLDTETVTRYTTAGAEAESFKLANMHGGGVGVNAATETLYVTDSAAGVVDIFGPEPPSAPAVESESVSKVTAESALLRADIKPHGAATEYVFEYGPCSTPTTCTASPYQVSTSVALGADFAVHAVAQEIHSSPHTVYHYRVAAHNGHGSALGSEQTFTTQTSGSGVALPDGRAWELVSPPSKHGATIAPIAEEGVIQAAAGGGAITYNTNAPTEAEPPGNSNNSQILSRRGATSWESYDLAIPHQSATGHFAGLGYEYRYFSTDLSMAVVQPFGAFEPSLSSEASVQTAYLRQTECTGSCYKPLVTSQRGYANVPPGTEFGSDASCAAGSICGPQFVGGTPDLSHVELESSVGLTAGTSGGLYDWSHGQLAFVGATSHDLSFYAISSENAPSEGPRVVFNGVYEGQSGALLMRDLAKGQTIRLDSPEKGVTPSGPATPRFQFASANGKTVYFIDSQRLTSDSGATEGSGGTEEAPDLYECRIVEEAGTERCDLTDVTPLHGSESADVLGVSGASEDGARIYFVADGVQGSGAATQPGSCSHGTSAEGTCNLYAFEAGHTELVAVLSGADRPDWQGLAAPSSARNPTGISARVSPDGKWLAFMSERSLTGYENRDAATGQPDEEVYLYHTTSGVVCASCNPTGARPTGVEYSRMSTPTGLAGGDRQWPPQQWLAASVPGWTPYRLAVALYQSRYLSDSGRLFFNSSDALVPQDVNGTEDVYEYEPQNVGSCTESSPTFGARSDGCVGLVSSGDSTEESAFVDASETGSDVFFLTSARLTPQDTDTSRDLYDAHECKPSSPCLSTSGVTSEEPCSSSTSCAGPTLPQPGASAPASTVPSGEGNLAPTPATTVKPLPVLTTAQKLSKALKVCKRKANKHKRVACEKNARRIYPLARRGSKPRKRSK
jgi:DNA-binding beta-propeller fold protein YncE